MKKKKTGWPNQIKQMHANKKIIKTILCVDNFYGDRNGVNLYLFFN